MDTGKTIFAFMAGAAAGAVAALLLAPESGARTEGKSGRRCTLLFLESKAIIY